MKGDGGHILPSLMHQSAQAGLRRKPTVPQPRWFKTRLISRFCYSATETWCGTVLGGPHAHSGTQLYLEHVWSRWQKKQSSGGSQGARKCSNRKGTHSTHTHHTRARASPAPPREARTGGRPEGERPTVGRIRNLEMSSNDYHIYENLRIPGLMCGRMFKTQHPSRLTCQCSISVVEFCWEIGYFSRLFFFFPEILSCWLF